MKLTLRQIRPGIRIEVTDTELGIAEDQIENICESFAQKPVRVTLVSLVEQVWV